MESSTSSYRNTLHLLLNKLSAEVEQVSSHRDFHKVLNSNSPEQLVDILKHLDSRIMSIDQNLRQVGVTSESTTDTLLLPGVSWPPQNSIAPLDQNMSQVEDTPEPPSDHVALFHEVVNGYAVLTIAAIGLILNILGIYFLSSGTRRGKILSLLVTSLLAFDAIYLSFQILKTVQLWFKFIPREYFKAYLMFVNSCMRSSLISSIFMLVAIARVRLCAIRKPFQHNNAILSWKDRRNFWLRYTIPIFISSLILTLPLFFEIADTPLETDEVKDVVKPTNLRLHPIYSLLYVGVLNLGVLGLIPIGYLMHHLYQIRTELKKSREQRQTLLNLQSIKVSANEESGDRHQPNPTNEESIELETTRGLVAIIIVFIAFHAFRIVMTISELCILLDPRKENGTLQGGGGVPIWFSILISLNNILMVINASVNVVIYLKPNSREVLKTFMPSSDVHVNRNRSRQDV